MSPDWKDKPEWATHLTQDQHKDWYWAQMEFKWIDSDWKYVTVQFEKS